MAHYHVTCRSCKDERTLGYLQYPERCEHCGSLFLDIYYNGTKLNLLNSTTVTKKKNNAKT